MAQAHMRAAILIIEDDAIIRRVLEKAIADLGFEPLSASNAVDGIALAVQTIPMGIVVDSTLPDIPLMSALRLLSSIPITQSIPLFVLALRVPPTVNESLRSIGVRSFLEKPFTKSSLEQRLQSVYGQRIMTLMKQRRIGVPQGLENGEEFASHDGKPFVDDGHALDEAWQQYDDTQRTTEVYQGHHADNVEHAGSDFSAVRNSSQRQVGARRESAHTPAPAAATPARHHHEQQPDYVSMSLAEVARMYGDRSRVASAQAMRDILDSKPAIT